MAEKFGKDNKRKRHSNERLRTSFANSGRMAGIGTLYDNYGDESFPIGMSPFSEHVKTPVVKKETEDEKNFREHGGEVVRYKLSEGELKELLTKKEAKDK